MTVQAFDPTEALAFTSAAATQAQTVIDDMGDAMDIKGLRVFVTGGGCSGFNYGFSFAEEIAEDDSVVVTDGVQLVIDPMSYQYLVGSTIDWKTDLAGSQFTINNPNATATCGCGSSFAM
jgi:iron-sulfur cluster insertion protein